MPQRIPPLRRRPHHLHRPCRALRLHRQADPVVLPRQIHARRADPAELMHMAGARIGIVGLGIMGSAIARNLITAGHTVSGFDTDPGKLAGLAADGVIGCGSAAEAARYADFLLTSLPTIEALEATVANLVAVPQRG